MGEMKRLSMAQLPTYEAFGLTVTQFAEAQNQFTQFARDRILIGAVEYDQETHQRIETLTAQQLVQELREELADAVNYLTGLDLFLSRLDLSKFQ